MQVKVAFMSQPSTDGSAKRFVVFEARSAGGDNQALLRQLSEKAKHAGMDFEWAALAFMQNHQITYFGSPALTQYLVKTKWVPSWTHTFDH
tara:strand:- start:137 stop:409 length:273 start_codon:yes stop_codon:yes gene_type:complete